MRSRVITVGATVVVLAAGTTALATGGAAVDQLSADGVTAVVTPTGARLGNGSVERKWAIDAGVVTTTALRNAAGDNLAKPGPEFTLTVGGVPTTSSDVWTLIDATTQEPPTLPGRPMSGSGAAVLFRYASPAADLPGFELDRLVVLHPGSSVLETSSTLFSHGEPARVTAYTIDQITAARPNLPAEVQAYNGGSDWRDDYRHVSTPTGAFDVEGEVARFGANHGYFLVSLRRGGSMSRAGRDGTGRSWVGFDWSHDLFDAGPILTDPPNYNRVDNPLSPVPVRGRNLPPNGSIDLGTGLLGVYSGGPQEAAASFTADFVGGQAPTYERTVGINTFHPWKHDPTLNADNLRKQVNAAAALGVETFMIDDQWQGGPGGESGDWQWDTVRFPDSDHDGVPDFVDYVQSKGLRLGLWMSPLEFNGASRTYAAHRDWACAPTGDVTAQIEDDAGLGVWDATNTEFQAYIVSVVDRLVRDDKVAEFKFDFMAWADCGTHDYTDYEAAFVDIVHRMQAHNPGVTFELDETNDQRCWAFESAQIGPSWFDNGHLHGSGPVEKLLHDLWVAAPWVPTWSMGVGAYDGTLTGAYAGRSGVDFLFPLAMLSHVTFWTDLTTLTAAERTETARWIRWFRAHRQGFGTTTYELTDSDPIDGTSWAAFEPWNGTSGYVFAFRPAGAPRDATTLAVQGVRPQTTYRVTDVRTGQVIDEVSGATLADGLRLTLLPATARVLSIRPV